MPEYLPNPQPQQPSRRKANEMRRSSQSAGERHRADDPAPGQAASVIPAARRSIHKHLRRRLSTA